MEAELKGRGEDGHILLWGEGLLIGTIYPIYAYLASYAQALYLPKKSGRNEKEGI